jgi:dTDP-4-dehydrorhamnose reductase
VRIVVTGAGGQLSTCLAELSRRQAGVELIALGRPTFDLERIETVVSAIEQARPDLVINAAAYTAVDTAEVEPDRAFAVNAVGAGEVARCAAAAGAPVIQLSTDYVFDGLQAAPYDEDAVPNPLNAYGRSKLEGEERVRTANPHHLIVRTSWVYSPFGRNFVKTMLDLARGRDEVRVVDDQHGSPTSAFDLAEALLRVASSIDAHWSNVLGQTFHVAGSGSCSWADLAEQVFAVSAAVGGPGARVQRIATADFPTKAVRPANSALKSARFERAFDHRMPEWPESVAGVVRRLITAGSVNG